MTDDRKDFLIHMETLGTGVNAVVLSLACLYVPDEVPPVELSEYNFKMVKQYGKSWKLDRKSQYKLGRTIDKDTVMYWKNIGEPAKYLLSDEGCTDVRVALMELNEFLLSNGFNPSTSVVWSRRNLDCMRLDSLFSLFSAPQSDISNLTNIIRFYNHRDIATACEIYTGNILGTDKNINEVKTAHYINKYDALDKCVVEYFRLTDFQCVSNEQAEIQRLMSGSEDNIDGCPSTEYPF